MHELSIAMSIVESVTAAVADEADATVQAVHVRVGAMSGVVAEALQFAWSEASRGTALAESALRIEWVEAVAWCPSCNAERELPGMTLVCPVCGTKTPQIVRGRELDILSLEVIDAPAAAHA